MAQTFSLPFEETFPFLLSGELQSRKNIQNVSIRELGDNTGWFSFHVKKNVVYCWHSL